MLLVNGETKLRQQVGRESKTNIPSLPPLLASVQTSATLNVLASSYEDIDVRLWTSMEKDVKYFTLPQERPVECVDSGEHHCGDLLS